MTKHTKMFRHVGTLTYRFNMFDEHNKELEFEILDSHPLTYEALRHRVIVDYASVLGIAQNPLSITYKTEVVIMEEK